MDFESIQRLGLDYINNIDLDKSEEIYNPTTNNHIIILRLLKEKILFFLIVVKLILLFREICNLKNLIILLDWKIILVLFLKEKFVNVNVVELSEKKTVCFY